MWDANDDDDDGDDIYDGDDEKANENSNDKDDDNAMLLWHTETNWSACKANQRHKNLHWDSFCMVWSK